MEVDPARNSDSEEEEDYVRAVGKLGATFKPVKVVKGESSDTWIEVETESEEEVPPPPLVEIRAGDDVVIAQMELKAHQWRVQANLQQEMNFAFRFSSHQEAFAEAGTAVAQDWSKVKILQYQDQCRIQAEASVGLQALESIQEEFAQQSQPAAKQIKVTGRSGPLTLTERTQSSAILEVKQEYITMLISMQHACSAQARPDSNPEVLEESFRRRAEAKADKAEITTLIRVLSTWGEIIDYAQKEDVDPRDLEAVQLEECIHMCTDNPNRAWAALHWLCSSMNLVWAFDQITPPVAKKQPDERESQANCADPNMMWSLETALKESIEEGRRDRLALLSQWLGVFGVRTRHVKRSVIVKVTKSFATGYCARGKQDHAGDGGFIWSAPAILVHYPAFNWAERVLPDLQTISEKDKYEAGLCFDPISKKAWANVSIVEQVKSYFQHLDNPHDISTHTWHHMGSTLATSFKFSPQEKSALSDWTVSSQGDQIECMPLRYADSKAKEARKVKGKVALLLGQLRTVQAWEGILQAFREEARGESQFIRSIDTMMMKDAETLYVTEANKLPKILQRQGFNQLSSMPFHSNLEGSQCVGTIFDLPMPIVESTHWIERAGKRKGHGKIMLVTNKLANGEHLCPYYQIGKCSLGSNCILRHGCAVVSQSTRICGLGHPAMQCWAKKPCFVEAFDMSQQSITVESLMNLQAAFNTAAEEEAEDREIEKNKGKRKSLDDNEAPSPAKSRKLDPVSDKTKDTKIFAAASKPHSTTEAAKEASRDTTHGSSGSGVRNAPPPTPASKASSAAPPEFSTQHKVGTVKCPKCGLVNRPGIKLCVKCHEVLPEAQVKAAMNIVREQHTNRVNEEWARHKDPSIRWRSKGNHHNPEPPRLVLKVGKGELWITGMPGAHNQELFPQVDLQIFCFEEDEVKSSGNFHRHQFQVPYAWTINVNMDNLDEAYNQWTDAFKEAARAVLCGQKTIIHCHAGIHRAAAVGIGFRAGIAYQDLWTSKKAIEEVRAIDWNGACKYWNKRNLDLEHWLIAMIRKSHITMDQILTDYHEDLKWRFCHETSHQATSTTTHVIQPWHGGVSKVAPMCRWKQRDHVRYLNNPGVTQIRLSEADAVRAAKEWGQDLCKECFSKLPASTKGLCMHNEFAPPTAKSNSIRSSW